MAGRDDDLIDLQVLDEEPVRGWRDSATAERDPGNWWKWLAGIVAAVAAVALVGSLLGDDPIDEEAAEAPTTTVPDPVPEFEEPDGPGREGAFGDATPSLTPAGVPEGVVGPFDGRRPLPSQTEPPGILPGTVLVGHNRDAEMLAIAADGRVTSLLGGDAFRFRPQAQDTDTVMGTLSFTGEWMTTDAEGRAVRFHVNDGDGPFFLAGGPGWVVHEKRTGQIRYLDRAGDVVGQGPLLLQGVDLVGVGSEGLFVRTLDGRTSLVSFDDGSLLAALEGDVLATAGDAYLHVRCSDGMTCEVALRSIAGSSALELPIDPARAARSVLGLSTSGRYVVYRLPGRLLIDDAATGRRVYEGDGAGLDSISWLEDDAALVWGADDPAVQLLVLSEESAQFLARPIMLDPLIDPRIRGVRLLRPAG